jgi:sec-independent protein translocase protein TatA
MQIFGAGGFEWIFIIVIIVVLFFGVKKIPQLARSFGNASSEYETPGLKQKENFSRLKIKSQLKQIGKSLKQ